MKKTIKKKSVSKREKLESIPLLRRKEKSDTLKRLIFQFQMLTLYALNDILVSLLY